MRDLVNFVLTLRLTPEQYRIIEKAAGKPEKVHAYILAGALNIASKSVGDSGGSHA